MLLYSNQYCTITYTAQLSLLNLTWLQQPDEESYLNCFKELLALAEAYKAVYVLTDNTKGIFMNLATQRSTIELAIQKIQQTPVKKFARVISTDAFQEVVSYRIMDTLNTMFPGKVQFEVFSNIGTAKAWLLNNEQQ